MNKIVYFAFTAMLMGGCDHSHNQNAAVENAAPAQEFYGEKFDLAMTSIPVSALMTNLEGKDSVETVIEGVIDQTCPNAGCWLNLKKDDGTVQKITTDHVFFVPLEGCEGLKAKAKGKAFYDEISVEDQQHYAREEGKTEEEVAAITEPKKILSFVATGVMIEGYNEPEGGAKTGSCNHDHGDGEHSHEHDHEHSEGEKH
jgi:hypothetical protein